MSPSPADTLLRAHLERLEASGRLVRIDRPVRSDHELAALAWRLEHTAVVFNHVVGHRLPVVANICPERRWLAEAMAVGAGEVAERFLAAMASPLPCARAAQSPYQPVAAGPDVDLAAVLPVTRDHDRQEAPVINGGVMVARDPASGRLNTSFHILELHARNEFVVHVVSDHFGRICAWHQRRGEPFPVAVLLGVDPVTWTAAGLVLQHPPSELEVAGAARGRPVELVAARTVNLEVPADAEVVIEGEILPGRIEAMGPEPRPSGYYGPPTRGPVLRVSCVAMRPDALFHVLVCGSRDHQLLSAIAKEVTVGRWVREQYPFVSRLSCYANRCVMAVRREGVHRVPEVLDAVLRFRGAEGRSFKFAVALDEDIDVFDREEVENALYTRLRPEGIRMVAGVRGSPGDPSATRCGVRKYGVDATVPQGEEERYRRPQIPGMRTLDLRSYVPELFVPLSELPRGTARGEEVD